MSWWPLLLAGIAAQLTATVALVVFVRLTFLRGRFPSRRVWRRVWSGAWVLFEAGSGLYMARDAVMRQPAAAAAAGIAVTAVVAVVVGVAATVVWRRMFWELP